MYEMRNYTSLLKWSWRQAMNPKMEENHKNHEVLLKSWLLKSWLLKSLLLKSQLPKLTIGVLNPNLIVLN